MNRHILLLLTYFTYTTVVSAQSFTVVPLGVKGGLDESNLSAYMVAAKGTTAYVCLDAGTLYSGIRKAIENGIFPPPASAILRTSIKGYFISHPHLDHCAGLIINSPDDSSKNIYGLAACLNVIKDKYFSWQSWANFADDGEKPLLKKYHYVTLQPEQEIPVDQTSLFAQAWPLSHGKPYESTAFLVRSSDNYLLYLGDTGADTIEQSNRLHHLWSGISPLVTAGKLKAIFIETSFPNEQPDKSLFGHLTPRLLMQEMQALEKLAGTGSLKGLPLVIIHRKPGIQEEVIRRQLETNNPLQVKLVFPEQGIKLEF